MSKTTTKLFVGSLIVAWCVPQALAWAGNQAALPLLLGASLGDDNRSPVAKAADLLSQARQAMAEGNYEIADSKITAAERLQPKYPLIPLGDTPKKARADLDKQMAQKAGSSGHATAPKDAKPGSDSRATDSHSGSANSGPTDPFMNRTGSGSATSGSRSTGGNSYGSAQSGSNPAGSGPSGSIFNNLPNGNGVGSASGMAGGTSGAKTPGSSSSGLPPGMSPTMPPSMRSQGGMARSDLPSAGGATPPMDLLQPNASRLMPADQPMRTTGTRSGMAQGNGYDNGFDSAPNARSPISSNSAGPRGTGPQPLMQPNLSQAAGLSQANGEVGPSVADLARMTAAPRGGLQMPDRGSSAGSISAAGAFGPSNGFGPSGTGNSMGAPGFDYPPGNAMQSGQARLAGLTQPASAGADLDGGNPWDADAATGSGPRFGADRTGTDRTGAVQPASRADDAIKKQTNAATQSDSLLEEARRLLARGDYRGASQRVDQAKGLGLTYSAMDDSPAKVESLIAKANKLSATATDNSERSRRLKAEVWMEEAEGLVRWHEYDEAQRLTEDVQRLSISYSPFEAKPEQLLSRIAEAKRAAGMLNEVASDVHRDNTPFKLPMDPAAVPLDTLTAAAKQQAIDVAKQARAAIAQGDLILAEQLAHQAEALAPDSAFGPNDDRPAFVLLDIQRAKQRTGSGTARPDSSLASQSPRYPGANAIYNPATDTTHNVMAGASTVGNSPAVGLPLPGALPGVTEAATGRGSSFAPSPENGTGEAQRWYRAGIDAMSHGNKSEALSNFRHAYAFQTELDPSTRRQLSDHLRILGDPVDSPSMADDSASGSTMLAAARIPTGPTSTAPATPAMPPLVSPTSAAKGTPPAPLSPDAMASTTPAAPGAPTEIATPAPIAPGSDASQALARQVSAEVTRQQGLARDMRERQPKQALNTLQRTREMVANVSGLETPARDQLLRRLDASIKDMQLYVDKNAPSIELEEQNKKIEKEVNDNRKQKVVVQEKLAYVVNDFNKAIEEQRWTDAQVLAKRAAELDPENPVVTQLTIMAKFVSRNAINQQTVDAKERGVWGALQEVDESSVPFVGEIRMPDAKKWKQLSDSPFRRQREGQMRRSPKEQEIEQRLNTPVSLKYENRPLTEVIDNLSKIVQVNTFIDPEGLKSEGVAPSTPVTIDLSQDISLKSALKLILEPLHLTYIIKDEVLKITSEDAKHGQRYQVTYPVGDLVIRIPNFAPTGREGINGALREGFGRMGWGGAAGGGNLSGSGGMVMANDDSATNTALNPALLAQMQMKGGIPLTGSGEKFSGSPQGFGPGGMKGGSQADFDSLIDLITSTIAAPTWSEMGGPGTIEPFETNLSLVVSQTQEVHEQIADLLQQLRRLQDLQVTIEVRFITLEDDFF
ncbi:MAG TPA: hypothetical protein VGJ15_05020, partial [Pirellulales bacterium]